MSSGGRRRDVAAWPGRPRAGARPRRRRPARRQATGPERALSGCAAGTWNGSCTTAPALRISALTLRLGLLRHLHPGGEHDFQRRRRGPAGRAAPGAAGAAGHRRAGSTRRCSTRPGWARRCARWPTSARRRCTSTPPTTGSGPPPRAPPTSRCSACLRRDGEAPRPVEVVVRARGRRRSSCSSRASTPAKLSPSTTASGCSAAPSRWALRRTTSRPDADHDHCEDPMRVALAEDGALFREGLLMLLQAAGHEVVGVRVRRRRAGRAAAHAGPRTSRSSTSGCRPSPTAAW